MTPQPKTTNGQQAPALLPENAASDLMSQPSLSLTFSNNQNHENLQLSPLLQTMYVSPILSDTFYDNDLESQFECLDLSSNPTHHSPQSHYRNNILLNNGGAGNYSSFGFDDYSPFSQFSNEELIAAYIQQQQQQQQQQLRGFFDASDNSMLLPRRSSSSNYNTVIPRTLNDNACEWKAEDGFFRLGHPRGMNFDNNGFFDVVPVARNACTSRHYNMTGNSDWYNGENIMNGYLLSSNNNNLAHQHQSRQRVMSLSNLESLRGRIVVAAKDQHGCKFLQKRIEERKAEEIEMIYREIRPHVRELMVDQFGNFLMQKLFEVCNFQQMSQLLGTLISDHYQLLSICVDTHGTRAMQKFLEFLGTEEQRKYLLSTLQLITLELCMNTNGHHVIRHCLKFFNVRENKQILDVVVVHCIDIATDRSGCCVLQQCVEHAQGIHKDRLVDEITKNALLLSENRYGNYVVQYLLGLGDRRITNDVLTHLKNNYVSLSMNKFGSNVVEKCLKEADKLQINEIIVEIITHNKFLMVLQDSYGNYVAQSALERAQGPIRDQMIREIQNHYPSLHSHPHGKRVLARAKGAINKQRLTS